MNHLMLIIQKNNYIVKNSILKMLHSQYIKYLANYYLLNIKNYAILYVLEEHISHKLSYFNKLLTQINNKEKTTANKYSYIPYQEATLNPKITSNTLNNELIKLLQATGLKEDFYTFIPITNNDQIMKHNKSIYTQYYGSCLNILNFHKELCAKNNYEDLLLKYVLRNNNVTFENEDYYASHVLNKFITFIMTTIPLNDIENIIKNSKFHPDPIFISKINSLVSYLDHLIIELKKTKENNRINFYTFSINKLNDSFYTFFFETFKKTKNSKEQILENYATLFPLLTQYNLVNTLMYFKLYYCYFHLSKNNNSLHHKMAWIMFHFHEYCINNDDYSRSLFIKRFRNIKKYLHAQDQLFLFSFIINLKLYRLLYQQGYRVYYDKNQIYLYDPYNSAQYADILYRREIKKYFPKFYTMM